MRSRKITAFLVGISLLVSVNLFPWVSSRVEGIVTDEETGQPIVGASVGLFQCSIHSSFLRYTSKSDTKTGSRYIKTDARGYFRFDDLFESEYFLAVFKEGYAAVGPFYYEKPGPFEESSGRAEIDKIERFYLKEGQIKHLRIQMEKEAILKVNVLRKTFEGIEPIDYFEVTLKHSDFLEKLKAYINTSTNKNPIVRKLAKDFGEKYIMTDEGFQTFFFKKGTVNLTLYPNGYPPQIFKDIQLEKGKVKLVEYVVDFTKSPLIYGVIENKETGEPFIDAYIAIKKQDDPNKYFYLECNPDKNGKYWLGGIEPGKYLLNIYNFGYKEFDFKITLNINHNSIIEINKEF